MGHTNSWLGHEVGPARSGVEAVEMAGACHAVCGAVACTGWASRHVPCATVAYQQDGCSGMADNWSDQFVSSQCVGDHHGDCRHVHGGPYPGGPESLYYVCHCACHQNCPLARTSVAEIVPAACTCLAMRALREPGRNARDTAGTRSENPAAVLFDVARHAREERRARREVDRVLSASAPGRSLEEVRAMIVEEYERRGLSVPPQPLLDYKADLYRVRDPKERERVRSEMRSASTEQLSPLAQHARSLFWPHRDK